MRPEDSVHFGGKKIDLSTVDFTPDLLRCLPKHLAHRYRALPIFYSAARLGIAVAGPPDLDVIDSLTHLLHRELEFWSADELQLDAFIHRFYGSSDGGER
jgi:type IV pilus assembly protein PilB